ncbi:hypothetical protein [Anaerobranca gottschalkii]|uniref:DUF3098 domain-containing protein n=1 Tax=Anaerobranca gottschalkii DSM 13577 TaxID=1120990 RepID=A0A1I0AM16_9FIRM|nr:hypothetical protein [Anaerobranca gottschalkii]SES95344.1 hypothetical protein SAMN03080614_10245 [Anaerobranca gottschalkii DSM 13577]
MEKGTPYFITGLFLTAIGLIITFLHPHSVFFPKIYYLIPAAAFILGIIAIIVDYHKK